MAVGEDHGGGGGMVTRCGHCDGGDENGLDGRRIEKSSSLVAAVAALLRRRRLPPLLPRAGRRFNRKIFGLSFGTKSRLRLLNLLFEYASKGTCLS